MIGVVAVIFVAYRFYWIELLSTCLTRFEIKNVIHLNWLPTKARGLSVLLLTFSCKEKWLINKDIGYMVGIHELEILTYLIFFNHFIPSNVIKPLRRKWLFSKKDSGKNYSGKKTIKEQELRRQMSVDIVFQFLKNRID